MDTPVINFIKVFKEITKLEKELRKEWERKLNAYGDFTTWEEFKIKEFEDFNKLKELQKEFKTLFQSMQEGNF